MYIFSPPYLYAGMYISSPTCLLALCLQITDAYDNRNSSGAGVFPVRSGAGTWVKSAKRGEVTCLRSYGLGHSSRRGLRPDAQQCECVTKWSALFAGRLFWAQGEPYQSGQPNTYNDDNRNIRHRASRQVGTYMYNNTSIKVRG